MTRVAAYFRTVKDYARIFSWSHLALFKLSDLLTAWVTHASMRRIRALRLFAYAVPPETLTVEEGEYRFRYSVNGREAALALRTRSSDVEVFLQVLRYEEYRDALGMLTRAGGPLKIIDAGANIGLTTLYFKSFRPDAHVVALEPEPENFERLSRCIRDNGLGDVTLLNEGIWIRDAVLAADRGFRDGEAWAFALKESGDGEHAEHPVISLASLLERTGWSEVDLMKIDIEGGEADLIRDRAFLRAVKDRVRCVCIEVHEEAISATEVREAFASIGMRSVTGGETLIAWRSAGGADA